MVYDTRRRGLVAVNVLVMLVTLLGFTALTIDTGAMYNTRADLQRTADACALAGALAVAADEDPYNAVAQIAASNGVFAHGPIELAVADVQSGRFDVEMGVFTNGAAPTNAVRVKARRDEGSANGALNLFFAPIFGINTINVTADAVAMVPPLSAVDETIPVGLRSPGFGPIDPDIADRNPGKDGPSEPLDEETFRIGEKVTLFIFGKGKKSPVHLVLNINDIPGEAQLGKVLRGEEPGVPLAVRDTIDVVDDGTGHAGLGGKLADRLDDDPDNDTIVIPVLKPIMDVGECDFLCQPTFNDDGELDGDVMVVDFIAVRLDAIEDVAVPDPEKLGEFIDIEILVGYVVRKAVGGDATSETSGSVEDSITGPLQLVQ